MKLDPTVRDGLVIAAISGIVHTIWTWLGVPCIYPKVRAFLRSLYKGDHNVKEKLGPKGPDA